MNEPDIAPLARRLAEENNVEWRRLEGSGDGGRIVERDVLTFLAKVMAGEEDLDPTPEPVPEGMESWPDADVAAYRAAAAAPPVERSVTSTLDDDLFLFDDAPGTDPAPAARDDVPPVVDERTAAVVATDAAPDAGDDDDGLLLVDEPDAPGGADVASGDGADGDDVFAFDEPAAVPPSTPSDLPELFELEPTLPAEPDDALFVDDGASPDERDGMDDAAGDRSLILDLDDRRASDADTVPADVVARRRADDHVDPGAAEGDGRERGVEHGLEYVLEDATSDVAAPGQVAARALEDADVALVRHGQVWRRRVDDRAFRSAVSQVADALGEAPSTVAVALLARAVHREWPGAGAVDGWWWGAEGARRGPVETEGRIADALAALARQDDGSGGPPALVVVADLSSIALDEAVLHLDAPVLALGRATGNGAWLTLSGDDVPRDAVAALGRVAEALGAPVRLLL